MEAAEKIGGIYPSMAKIMTDIKAIGKDKENTQQNFKFRGIDDMYNSIHDILATHDVFMLSKVLEDKMEERVSSRGGALIYRILKIEFYFVHADGSHVSSIIIGEGMDSGDKASNKAMAIAHKYCLLQAFCIPTKDLDDPDATSPEVEPKQQPQGRGTPRGGNPPANRQGRAPRQPQGQPPAPGQQPPAQGEQQQPRPKNPTMLERMQQFGVSKADLEAAIGSPYEKFTDDDKRLLLKTLTLVKGGMPFAEAIVEAQN